MLFIKDSLINLGSFSKPIKEYPNIVQITSKKQNYLQFIIFNLLVKQQFHFLNCSQFLHNN